MDGSVHAFVCLFACPSVPPSVCLSVCPSIRPSIRLLSVRPSIRLVCLSVCLSHLFHYVPIIISSWKFQELLPLIEVMSMQKFKNNLQFEIWNKIQNISTLEIYYMKMLSAKWQPFNVLRIWVCFCLHGAIRQAISRIIFLPSYIGHHIIWHHL